MWHRRGFDFGTLEDLVYREHREDITQTGATGCDLLEDNWPYLHMWTDVVNKLFIVPEKKKNNFV